MPQTLVQKNGRWQLVGDDHSHDHIPPPPTPGAKPKAKPQKPKAKAPQKPWWHAITNELRYAGKQLRSLEATQKPGTVRSQNPALSALTLLGLGPTGILVNEAARRSPVVRQLQAAIGPGALQTEGEGVIALGQSILAPGKYADARRSPPGRALNAYVRAGYQALGAKQPEDLTEGQRGVVDNTGRMIGVEVATSLVGGPIGKGLTVGVKGVSWASRGVRWGTALGVTHGLSSFLQDSTQGNPSNMLEAATGIKGIPFAVDPTKDDRVTSGFKSIIPNIAVGELIGLAGSAGAQAVGKGAKAAGKSLRVADSLIQKGAEWEADRAFKKWAAGAYDPRHAEKIARQFENIRRYRRAAGANTAHVTAGEKLQARGLVEEIEGQQRFTEQALEKPAPAPIPQTPDEARDAVLARWGRGAQQPANQVPGATEMVTTPVESKPVATTNGAELSPAPETVPAATPVADQANSIEDMGRFLRGMGGGFKDSLYNSLWEGLQGRGAMQNDLIVRNTKAIESKIGRPLGEEEFQTLVSGVYDRAGNEQVTIQHWIGQFKEQFASHLREDGPAYQEWLRRNASTAIVPVKPGESAPVPPLPRQPLAPRDELRGEGLADPWGMGPDPSSPAQQSLGAKTGARQEPPAPAVKESLTAPAAADEEVAPLDPWSYDPALPEVADAQKLVSQLDPAELEAIATVGADGGPVLQHIEEVIASRPAPQPRPEISEAWAGVPTNSLSEIYLNGIGELQPWAQLLDKINPTTLKELSHPEASPRLSQLISDATGKAWEAFDREDMINGIRALSADGTTILPNRLSGDVRLMRVDDLAAAPQEFQYKEGVDAKGVQIASHLRDVKKWDPNAEGVLEVFPDPRDGITKVVEGHGRRALAKRLGIPTVPVKEVNATNVPGARSAGAISNISQGNGTPFDAAKFIKGTGMTDKAQLQAAGIALDRGFGRQGLALSKLPPEILQDAVNSEHKLGRYVALGESGLDEPGMRGAYQALKQRPKMTEDTFREVLDQAKQQGNVVASSAQGGLFGDEVLNPMLQRAELSADVRAALAKDRRLFGIMIRNADTLLEAGNTTIDTVAAGQRVADAQQALGLFDTLKNQAGPVGELLSKGAERIAQGENASIVVKQIQREIGDSIERELANSGMKATPQELAPPPPPPPPIPEPDRATLEAHAIQRAIANGEVRPTEMGPLDLPPAPSADIRAVERELAAMDPTLPLEDQLPNMPATRQAAADELRLAAEYARQDAEIAWAAEKAAREAEGYDLLSLQEKKAQGLGQDWVAPGNRNLSPETKDKLRTILTNTIREVAGDDAVIRFNDTYPVQPIPREWGGMPGEVAAVKGSYTPHQPPDFEQDYITINGMDSPVTLLEGTETAYHEAWHRIQHIALGENEAKILDSTWARLKIAIGSGHALDGANISYGESQAVAVQRYAAARKGGTDPTQYLLASYAPESKVGKLALKFFSGVDRVLDFGEKVWNALSGNGFMSTRSIFEDFRQGNLIEKYDYSAAPLREYSKDGWFQRTWDRGAVPTPGGSDASLSSIFREASGAPEFTLPPELAKNPPTYGRNALQFESDLDRAAYMLATKPVDGRRKTANKLRNALAAAGFDPDQVAAHGKAVQQAVESVSRDTSGGQVVVPVQDFAAGRPRLPLPEQQRQIEGTKAQIEDLQQKLNEGGCGT